MVKLPENLVLLHNGEEELRNKTIEAIEASENLSAHIALIEVSMDLLDYFIRHYKNENEDQLAIQCLGIRLFNSAASILKLIFSGYYQDAAKILRDILETAFLLDYFRLDCTHVAEWHACDEDSRNKKFAPVKIRKALDARDGFTERKREKAYKILCNLAAHPTPQGFRMLTPIPGGDALCGPFYEESAMKACVEELAKLMVQVGELFECFFDMKAKADGLMKMAFLEEKGKWIEKFFGRKFDAQKINEAKEILKHIEY